MCVRVAEAFCIFVDFRRLGVGAIDFEGDAVAEGVYVLAQAAVGHDNILSPRKKIRDGGISDCCGMQQGEKRTTSCLLDMVEGAAETTPAAMRREEIVANFIVVVAVIKETDNSRRGVGAGVGGYARRRRPFYRVLVRQPAPEKNNGPIHEPEGRKRRDAWLLMHETSVPEFSNRRQKTQLQKMSRRSSKNI
jgi:hypothetical protein